MQMSLFGSDSYRDEGDALVLDGADIAYVQNWLSQSDADALLSRLRTSLPWRQDTIKLYGKAVKIPRLQVWMGEPQCIYTYSGLTMEPLPWSDDIAALKRRCEAHTQSRFNCVLLNWYRDGQDSMGLHADDEPELGPNPVIASVSLGQARPFIFKHKHQGTRSVLPLEHGSLLVMAGETQQHYHHGIAKTTRSIGDRINLTFRYIQPHE